MLKVNRAESPLFFQLESLETRLDKFSNGLDKFSKGLERLETQLEPRSFRELRIENRVSSIELRGTVNLPLSGTVHFRVNSLFHYLCSKCYAAQHSYIISDCIPKNIPTEFSLSHVIWI